MGTSVHWRNKHGADMGGAALNCTPQHEIDAHIEGTETALSAKPDLNGQALKALRYVDHLTDLHHASNTCVVALVCNKLGGRRCQRAFYLSHGTEE